MNDRFIGLTIGEALKILKNKESFFQFYVVVEKTTIHNFKKYDSKVFYHDKNGKRAYRIITQTDLIFAKNDELENDNFIINVKKEIGEHDNWSFNGYESTHKHNVYYFYVSHLQKGNEGHRERIERIEKLEPFTEQELKKVNHRFTL